MALTATDLPDSEFLNAVGAVTPGQVERARRARQTAVVMVARYAPTAPTDAMIEAVIRLVGYLLQIVPGSARQTADGPAQRTIHIPAGVSPLRSSGAMAILSPWKVRRAI